MEEPWWQFKVTINKSLSIKCTMKTLFSIFLSIFVIFSSPGSAREFQNERLKIAENNDYVMFIYNSSITNLPPDWKKVWVLKNFKWNSSATPPKVKSNRSNIVFDCIGMTYYTLSSINYSELDALSKPVLQLNSGFNAKEIPVETNPDFMIIFNQLCKKTNK